MKHLIKTVTLTLTLSVLAGCGAIQAEIEAERHAEQQKRAMLQDLMKRDPAAALQYLQREEYLEQQRWSAVTRQSQALLNNTTQRLRTTCHSNRFGNTTHTNCF